jgi:two-component system, OmpR family, phosphate regulon response regulator PhoB
MPTPQSPSTILIVEDDEVLGQVLARVLTCEGRIARHVSTAGEALQQVREGVPRLVLVDAELRDGTGLKLADAIRASGARLPVILLMTHHLEKSDRPGRGEKLVTKSIDLPELRRTIDAALLESPSTDGHCDLSPGTPDLTGVAAQRPLRSIP